MSEPTKPTKPTPPEGPTPPPERAAPTEPTAPTAPLPAVAAAGSGGAGAGGGGGGAGSGGGAAGGGGGYQPGPPPRRPGLFGRATSTTGGTIALVVAGALAALVFLGVAGLVAVLGLRAVAQEHREDRIEQVREGWEGEFPPGQQKKLDRGPKMPDLPGQRGNDERGNAQGDGFGPFMRGALALGNIQHGEFTVQDVDTGKPTVMTVQRGVVTAAADTSVSVRSADGFTAKYVVDDETKGRAGDVAVGDEVLVVAEKTGAKALMIRPGKLKS